MRPGDLIKLKAGSSPITIWATPVKDIGDDRRAGSMHVNEIGLVLASIPENVNYDAEVMLLKGGTYGWVRVNKHLEVIDE